MKKTDIYQRADHITREKRADLIARGLWMGRGCVHKSEKTYNRQKDRLLVRKAIKEAL